MSTPTDAIVVGAGIVGAACAYRLAQEGLLVTVIDPRGVASVTTAAGMGHISVMDGSDAELALTLRSRTLFHELASRLPHDAAWSQCGTLWVAADDAEMKAVHARASRMSAVGVEVVKAADLATLEPRLRPGLAGGLRVPGDAILRPPAASTWMLEQARARMIHMAGVKRASPHRVVLDNGEELAGGAVVLAAGLWLRELAGLPLRAKKGHLVSLEGPVGFCKHQVLEMGYMAKAHGERESVSFNIQPRAGGELVVGSSRQPGVETAEVEQNVVGKMLGRAVEFMPDLKAFRIAREWTGLRAATPDGLPVIGAMADGVYVAGGHEGLGLTMSLGTAELIADLILGRPPTVDPLPYSPSRFGKVK